MNRAAAARLRDEAIGRPHAVIAINRGAADRIILSVKFGKKQFSRV
jgi:hypothetical protein